MDGVRILLYAAVDPPELTQVKHVLDHQ